MLKIRSEERRSETEWYRLIQANTNTNQQQKNIQAKSNEAKDEEKNKKNSQILMQTNRFVSQTFILCASRREIKTQSKFPAEDDVA